MTVNEEPAPMRWGDKVRVTEGYGACAETSEVMDWADLVLASEEGRFDGLDDRHGSPVDPGGQTLAAADGTRWVHIRRVTLVGADS